jgi:hypothetical protein
MFGHNLSFPKIMPYPFRDVAVHLKRVFDAYGPQRRYWGTDLTNSYAKASYRQRINSRKS